MLVSDNRLSFLEEDVTPDVRRDEPVVQVLTEMAERYSQYGFMKLFRLLFK